MCIARHKHEAKRWTTFWPYRWPTNSLTFKFMPDWFEIAQPNYRQLFEVGFGKRSFLQAPLSRPPIVPTWSPSEVAKSILPWGARWTAYQAWIWPDTKCRNLRHKEKQKQDMSHGKMAKATAQNSNQNVNAEQQKVGWWKRKTSRTTARQTAKEGKTVKPLCTLTTTQQHNNTTTTQN